MKYDKSVLSFLFSVTEQVGHMPESHLASGWVHLSVHDTAGGRENAVPKLLHSLPCRHVTLAFQSLLRMAELIYTVNKLDEAQILVIQNKGG